MLTSTMQAFIIILKGSRRLVRHSLRFYRRVFAGGNDSILNQVKVKFKFEENYCVLCLFIIILYGELKKSV